METGHFYFLIDKYFVDFPDLRLERNKESINGKISGRPCFYAFLDISTQLSWMIPISSKVAKYESIYQNKIRRYGKCDTIVFGDVLGYKKAFLIQNMFPVTPTYVDMEYISSNTSVKVNGFLEKKL